MEKTMTKTHFKRIGPLIYDALLALLLFAGLPSHAMGGAWTQKEGGMYNRFAVNYLVINDQFTSGGNKTPTSSSTFTEWNATYYAELGLKDFLTVFGSLPVRYLQDQSESNTGVGDLDLGMRYRLLSGPTVLSVSVLGKFPYFYKKTKAPALGNGQHDLELRFLVGKGFNQYGYGGIEAGYRYRDEAPSDEYRYLLEYGLSFTKQFYARTKLDGVKSVKNADRGATSSTEGNPILSSEFDIGKLEMTAGYLFNQHWTGEITYTYVAYGKNIGAGNPIQIAVVYGF